MRIKILFGVLAMTAAVAAAPAQDKPAPSDKKAAPAVSLIRMDLLKIQERPNTTMKRDLFIPERQSMPMGIAPAGSLMSGTLKQPQRSGVGAQADAEPGPPPEPVLNARYVGYIRGKTRITALVLFENRAMAIDEGEPLDTVWKVVKITTEGIDVQGADGKTQSVALEGERK